jgi:hypothetical protein
MLGIELVHPPLHASDSGALVALDRNQNLPFKVQRLFVIFACPEDATRAAHSSTTHQAILAVQGSVTVDLDNGREQATLVLDSVDRVLCIHAGVWLRLRNFSPATIIVVAASKLFSETEYFDRPKTELLSSLCTRPWS